MSAKRYKVLRFSQSSHCCFEATVVDTDKPDIIGGKHYFDKRHKEYRYEAVCECFDVEAAEKICAALNAAQEAQT